MASTNINKPRKVTHEFGTRKDKIKADKAKKRRQQLDKAKRGVANTYKTSKKVAKVAGKGVKKADKLASVMLRGFKW